MKKDVIATPLLPFTEDEETALTARLDAMDAVALGHYADSARQALGNRALDASWRPRIQHGLTQAEAAIARLALLGPVVVEEPAPVPAKTTRAKKTTAKTAEAATAEAETETEAEADDETESAEA